MCLAATSAGISFSVRRINLELGQVNRRHPVVPGQQLRDLEFGDDSLLGDDVAQAVTARLGLGVCRRKLVASQQTFLQKEAAEKIHAYRH